MSVAQILSQVRAVHDPSRTSDWRRGLILLQAIGGTLQTHGSAIQDVRVNHGRADISVTQQFLDSANVIAVLEKMRRERVAVMPRAA
jgi:hypothetical protein